MAEMKGNCQEMNRTRQMAAPSRAKIKAADAEIGARIRRRRRNLGLTQQDLAKAAGVSYQQIQKYERGTNRVSASRLYLISLALETNPMFFFENLGGYFYKSEKMPVEQPLDHPVIDHQVREALSNLVSALKESATGPTT